MHEHYDRARWFLKLATQCGNPSGRFRLLIASVYSARAIVEIMLNAAKIQDLVGFENKDGSKSYKEFEKTLVPRLPYYSLIEKIRIHDFHRFGLIPPNPNRKEVFQGGPVKLIARKGAAVMTLSPTGPQTTVTGASQIKEQRPLCMADGRFFDDDRGKYLLPEDILEAFLNTVPDVIDDFERLVSSRVYEPADTSITRSGTDDAHEGSRRMNIIRRPSVYLVGRQVLDDDEVARFLEDHDFNDWSTDTDIPAEVLPEVAGRLCYMSFSKPRPGGNEAYLSHIKQVGHGSVLEHTVFNFIITGVSRSFTHELVRHRAGFGYSQLSQRYVDESVADFIEPACIADDPKLHETWQAAVERAQEAYVKLIEGLQDKFASVEDRTLRRKMARQAARSVLPNATETKIFVTANARSLRHFIELRCNEHAEVEIREVAAQILEILRQEAPSIFGDYEFFDLPDGTRAVKTPHTKV